MDKLYDLKEMLCEELKEYGSKDKLDVGGLEIVDKLAHAVKNIDKIIETYEEEGYSSEGYGGGSGRSYARGGNRRYSRTGRGGSSYEQGGGGSYARGQGRGARARRDSMGRYSGNYSRGGDMVEELRELMEDAPNEQTRMEMERLIQKLEQM